MLHELQVPDSANGSRLDVFLEARLEGCSRSLVARCVKAGRCTIDPGKAKPGYRLRGGERVAIEVPELEPLVAEPEDLPLEVLHEDHDLLVIDKAPGMVAHPAVGHPRGTVLNAVLGRYRTDGAAPALIHRLDADTSGVLAIARHPRALAWYQQAFRERRVRKHYLAIAHGAPASDVFEHRGWIGRHPRDFRRRAVRPEGSGGARAAHTGFVVRARGDGYAVVECRLYTGRTHQIRVHLADLGHPVVADGVYGRSAGFPVHGADAGRLQRQALHAWRLELPRPDGQALVVEAPIPADLAPWLPAEFRPLVG